MDEDCGTLRKPMAADETIHAAQVLNLPYLAEIARYIENPRNWPEALRVFAYGITTTESVEHQDRLLSELLLNSTRLQSAESNEETVATLARGTGSNVGLVRLFAKQIGVRLKRS